MSIPRLLDATSFEVLASLLVGIIVQITHLAGESGVLREDTINPYLS